MPYKDASKQKEYQRIWTAKRRAFAKAIFGNRCCLCGAVDSLEFDHINKNDKISHTIWTWSSKRVKEELLKCQLLCHSCHSVKTWKENGITPYQHGTRSMYLRHACRCDRCKEWNKLNYRKRRARKKLLTPVTQ